MIKWLTLFFYFLFSLSMHKRQAGAKVTQHEGFLFLIFWGNSFHFFSPHTLRMTLLNWEWLSGSGFPRMHYLSNSKPSHVFQSIFVVLGPISLSRLHRRKCNIFLRGSIMILVSNCGPENPKRFLFLRYFSFFVYLTFFGSCSKWNYLSSNWTSVNEIFFV